MVFEMVKNPTKLKNRFRGALIGTMIGVAFGMPVEGYTASMIKQQYGTLNELLPARLGQRTYTDDTQMTIGVAEAFLSSLGEIHLDSIAARFAENFDPPLAPSSPRLLSCG